MLERQEGTGRVVMILNTISFLMKREFIYELKDNIGAGPLVA